MLARILYNILEWLNHYSSLLLVIITAIYAFLTFRTLQTLNRANLREREANHLNDIKNDVAAPLLQWTQGVVDRLEGRQSTLMFLMPSLDDDRKPEGRSQLLPAAILFNELNQKLYIHSKEHFPEQLRSFDPFHNAVETLFGEIAAFANECCDRYWKSTNLFPQKPNQPFGGFTSFANFESLLYSSLSDLLCGVRPRTFTQGDAPGKTTVIGPFNMPGIMRDSTDNVEAHLSELVDDIENRWKRSELKDRVRRTLEDAKGVRESLEEIRIHYALNRPCKFVGA